MVSPGVVIISSAWDFQPERATAKGSLSVLVKREGVDPGASLPEKRQHRLN